MRAPARLCTTVSFSWCGQLNVGFAPYACRGTLTLIQSQYFTRFYDLTSSLTSKDNGQLGERPSVSLSSPPALCFTRWMNVWPRLGHAPPSAHLHAPPSAHLLVRRVEDGEGSEPTSEPSSHGAGTSVGLRKLGVTWSYLAGAFRSSSPCTVPTLCTRRADPVSGAGEKPTPADRA